MIDLEADANRKVGSNPYATDEPSPYNEMDYGTRAMLSDNRRLYELVLRLLQFSDRQREINSPEVLDLSPASGSQIVSTVSMKTGMRVTAVLITGAIGDQVRLTVGGRRYNFFQNGYFPFPIDIQQGVDVAAADITNPASVNWSFYVFGYNT